MVNNVEFTGGIWSLEETTHEFLLLIVRLWILKWFPARGQLVVRRIPIRGRQFMEDILRQLFAKHGSFAFLVVQIDSTVV